MSERQCTGSLTISKPSRNWLQIWSHSAKTTPPHSLAPQYEFSQNSSQPLQESWVRKDDDAISLTVLSTYFLNVYMYAHAQGRAC